MWVVNQSNKLPREAVDALSKVFSQAGWGSEQPHLVEGLELMIFKVSYHSTPFYDSVISFLCPATSGLGYFCLDALYVFKLELTWPHFCNFVKSLQSSLPMAWHLPTTNC